ncbi:MAG: carboxypeptidase regulatory-like domain-containing protein [Rubricoccaceae bacterium]
MLLALLAGSARAQTAEVCVRVTLAGTGEALPGVVVRVEPHERVAATRADGTVCVGELPPGAARLSVSRLGLAPAARDVRLEPGQTARVAFTMAFQTFRSPEAVVTAEASSTEAGTASRVGRGAIEHVQAASLADLLQLLPGQTAGNPSLANPGQILLRQAPTTAEAARNAALGTAIVVDGVPVSNNANLQTDVTILNSSPGALPPFASTAGRGTDLRAFSPDVIESVEVIRGVPAARHGDVSAGVVLVETRAGARQPEARLRLNPTLLDVGVVSGWGGGTPSAPRPGLSAALTATASRDDPRQTADTFSRLRVQTAWTQPWRPGLRSTARLALSAAEDRQRVYPNDVTARRTRSAADLGVQASLDLRAEAARPLLGFSSVRAALTASATAARQQGRFAELITRSDIFPLSPALTDTTMVGVFGPAEYFNETTVDGRPVNLYVRLEGRGQRSLGPLVFAPRVGAEARYDVNRGAGRQFDVLRPPRQNYAVGERPRAFADVPGLGLLSGYAEARLAAPLPGRRLAVLDGGLRLDRAATTAVAGRPGAHRGTVLAPRINAAVDLSPGGAPLGTTLRGGYGLLAKVTPLTFLSPGPRFFDLTSYAYFAPVPAERLVVLTTRRVDLDALAAELRPTTTRRREAGLDLRLGPAARPAARAELTAFADDTRRAVGIAREVVPLLFPRFEAVAFPPGAPPVLRPEPVRTDTFLAVYDVPRATRSVRSRGLEATLDVPRLPLPRTSLNATAAWTRTQAEDDATAVDAGALFRSPNRPDRIGVYREPGVRREQVLTAVRAVYRLPEAGLVASALVQTLWLDADRLVPQPSGADRDPALPVAFVDRAGRTVALSPAEAEALPALRRPFGERAFVAERRPPLWLLNARLSASLPAGLQLAAFVNNVLFDRPLYERRRGTGGFEQRNPPLFFGLEMAATL